MKMEICMDEQNIHICGSRFENKNIVTQEKLCVKFIIKIES